jgi:hypothetical protein
LDCLLHRITVKGPVFGLPAFLIRLSKDFQCLVLGRSRKGEVARIRQELLGLIPFPPLLD